MFSFLLNRGELIYWSMEWKKMKLNTTQSKCIHDCLCPFHLNTIPLALFLKKKMSLNTTQSTCIIYVLSIWNQQFILLLKDQHIGYDSDTFSCFVPHDLHAERRLDQWNNFFIWVYVFHEHPNVFNVEP